MNGSKHAPRMLLSALGGAALLAFVLFLVQPASAQLPSATASGGTSPTAASGKIQTGDGKAADGKAADGKAGAAKAGDGKAQTGDGKPEETKPSYPRVDAAIAIMKAISTWSFIALVALVVFIPQLRGLLQAVVDAMPDRGVSLEAGSVKIQLTERGPDAVDETRPLFSPSPFEIDDPPTEEGLTQLKEPDTQDTFPVSDRVASYLQKKGSLKTAVACMRLTRNTLRGMDHHTRLHDVRTDLLRFVHALEEARFRQAAKFADLLDGAPQLKVDIEALHPKDTTNDSEDCLLLYAMAVAVAQRRGTGTVLAVLEKLACREGHPFYLAAGPTYVIALYNSVAPELRQLSDDKVQEKTDRLIRMARQFVGAIDALPPGKHLAGLRAPIGHYKREAHKCLGVLLSAVADQLSSSTSKDPYLREAASELKACVKTIDTDPPSGLDHNNLADVYRQLGDHLRRSDRREDALAQYDQAEQEFVLAFQHGASGDPSYDDTLARIRIGQGRFDEAWWTLRKYSAVNAHDDDDAPKRVQYLENQILAAKVALAMHAQKIVGLWSASETLECARTFLHDERKRLPDEKAARTLETRILELLAFAYLRTPRMEEHARETFERLFALSFWTPAPAQDVRARAGWAAAAGRLARLHRLQAAPGAAAALRKTAGDILYPPTKSSIVDRVKVLKIDSDNPDLRRRQAGIWLDALRAMQLLAEERFAGSDRTGARELADAEAPLLETLTANCSSESKALRDAVQRVGARHKLLDARLIIAADPTVKKPETVPDAESRLRGVFGDASFECQSDVETGKLYLTAAVHKRGDVEADYRESIAAFERAAGRDAPSLRADVINALVHARSLRSSILRAAKPAASK